MRGKAAASRSGGTTGHCSGRRRGCVTRSPSDIIWHEPTHQKQAQKGNDIIAKLPAYKYRSGERSLKCPPAVCYFAPRLNFHFAFLCSFSSASRRFASSTALSTSSGPKARLTHSKLAAPFALRKKSPARVEISSALNAASTAACRAFSTPALATFFALLKKPPVATEMSSWVTGTSAKPSPQLLQNPAALSFFVEQFGYSFIPFPPSFYIVGTSIPPCILRR